MVRINTGLPPTGKNCLGISPPIRNPLPPATIMTCLFILQSSSLASILPPFRTDIFPSNSK